jgi:hypothetical protein
LGFPREPADESAAVDLAKTNRAAEETNLDGAVNAQDIAALFSSWGSCSDPDPATRVCTSDVHADGVIDAAVLARLLGAGGN